MLLQIIISYKYNDMGVDRLLVCLAVFKTVVGGLEPPGWVRFPPPPSYQIVGGNLKWMERMKCSEKFHRLARC